MKAVMYIDAVFTVGSVDRRLFGSFVEHLGRSVYTGIYEPGHFSADSKGMRGDVINLVRELNVPIIRYPGGNFVSGYRWEDGIGPVENRPARLDLAWRTMEPNEVGIDEFMHWAEKVGTEPLMAVNLGTRGIDAARSLIEYCNLPGGTYWSNLRRQNGHADPYSIKTWCLGNEMDGPWQLGHKCASDYGKLAAETGKVMKLVDPSIELVSCGSSKFIMPTFPSWECETLEYTYDIADYISMHDYFGNWDGNTPEYLALNLEMDSFIQTVKAACDYVKAKKRSPKTMYICFDEWNIWFHNKLEDKRRMKKNILPAGTPLLEEHYTHEDAILIGELLITLLKNADRVKIACIAQLVNVIAPIIAEKGGKAWRQTIFFPFQQVSCFGRGKVMLPAIESPTYKSERFGDVPYIEAIGVVDEDEGHLTVFAVNRSLNDDIDFQIETRGFGKCRLSFRTEMISDDLKAENSADSEKVRPIMIHEMRSEGRTFDFRLKKASWNMIRFDLS